MGPLERAFESWREYWETFQTPGKVHTTGHETFREYVDSLSNYEVLEYLTTWEPQTREKPKTVKPVVQWRTG